MPQKSKASLTEGPVAPLLVRLTIPMILGMVGMMAFNLADTYFVGQLGTRELAAMSFTFPVVMVISSLALGLGMGASAVVSRAIGEGDQHQVQRLTTDSLGLSLLFVGSGVLIGLLTIEPLFRALGASEELLPLIRQYMLIWYPGSIAVVIPMVGNNAIRATGDTTTPSMVMLTAVCINIILDPLLIFGIGPFPRLELAGAALATVFSRMTTLTVSLWILYHRDRMLTFARPAVQAILVSWKRILYIALPSAGTNIILPLSAGIITRLVASYGTEAVAGFGVATRIEMFAIVVVMALSSVLGPFVGQNRGAKRFDRLFQGIAYSQNFSMIWGAAMYLLLSLFGKSAAALFNDHPDVVATTAGYFLIVPLGYGAQGVLRLSTISLSVLNKPFHSALLTMLQAFVCYIPLAWLGSQLVGLKGIFSAAAFSYLIAGLAAHIWLKHFLRQEQAANQLLMI